MNQHTQTFTRMIRLSEVRHLTGQADSTIYEQIQHGLLPSPVKMGKRMATWPLNELQAVIAARIAGHDEEAIRELVNQIHQQRKAPSTAFSASGFNSAPASFSAEG